MDELLLFLGVIVVAIPLTLVVLIFIVVGLRSRVYALEAKLAELQSNLKARADAGAEPAPSVEKPAIVTRPSGSTDPVVASEEKAEPTQSAPWGKAVGNKPAPTAEAHAVSTETPNPSEDGPVVFKASRITAFAAWPKENWFYAVSAVSLALAGIYLVQYGVENGLLPPEARIFAALGFGALLILVGEGIRRRFGDGEDVATAYLPSVFSSAGVVTLFGAELAARQLYGLIGAETALFAMVGTAALGLILGWFHGPLLAAVGLIGGFSAPFLVGGASADLRWLFGYFALVTALGLGIDTLRRWAWVSVLALLGAFGSAWLLTEGTTQTDLRPALMIYATGIAYLAIMIPSRALVPQVAGPTVSSIVLQFKASPWPVFPARLAFGAMAASCAFIAIQPAGNAAEFWLSVALLSMLALSMILWARQAEALQDLTVYPVVGLMFVTFTQGIDFGAVAQDFARTYEDVTDADYPWSVTVLTALGAILSMAAAYRSSAGHGHPEAWAGGAAITAPALAIVLELGWTPSTVLGAYEWGLHALALGALMVMFAVRFARADGDNRMRTALAALSALSCLAFACVIVLSDAALTVALAVTVAAAAWLDKRFNLAPMGWFIAIGVATIGFRLVVDPGLVWGEYVQLPHMLLAYGGTLIAFVFAWMQLRGMERVSASLILESAAWSTVGIFLSLLLLRWLNNIAAGPAYDSHWAMGLTAAIWFALSFAQIQRMTLGGWLKTVRAALASVFGLIAIGALVQAVTEANPLLTRYADPVVGPAVFNSLGVAYLLPALIIGVSAWRVAAIPRILRMVSGALAIVLAGLWVGLAIRHFWQGPQFMHESNGVTQPELYSYTIALLLVGALVFYQSLARRSDAMRKLGLTLIGLAVAKVFLIDIAGLGGLIRVFSLLALGLSLAALAWLNRWAMMRHRSESSEPLDQ